jgi:membrane protease YdiL (CAAX protease family)
MASGSASLKFPLLLAIAAPLAVIVSIEWLHSVWWTFATYQVFICLVAPAIESRRNGRSWRDHAALLGLRGRKRTDGGGESSRSLLLAMVLGLITMLVTGGFLVITHARFLNPSRLDAALAAWGVSSGQVLIVLAIMAVLDAAAEELFWRGYFPGRVELAFGALPIALTVVLPAALYASYHAATIGRLIGDPSGVAVMTGGVLGAGLAWGWLRQRTHSVWPALLSHSGAVIAYLAVHLWLTRGKA